MPNLFHFLFARWAERNIRILQQRDDDAKGSVPHLMVEDETADPLDEDDRALLELAGETSFAPDDRILLASGRIITGTELATHWPSVSPTPDLSLEDALREYGCGEAWRDEVGCDSPGPHVCTELGEHRTHRCPCGSLVIEAPRRTHPVSDRVNMFGGTVRIGGALVHRGCANALPARVCAYCGPLLAQSAMEAQQ